jgi:hypothetical protein
VLAEGAVGFGRRPAAAHEQDRVHDRETENPERQAEGGKFVPLELRKGGDVEIDRG